LGSAPSIHLAIQKSYNDVKAIILISPIASGVKLVSPGIRVKDLDKIDVFCNINKINDVSCPIFIIHGEKDEVIPISQSKEMVKYMKIPYEWHPRHGDHSNILTRYRTKFFQKCKFFFEFLDHAKFRDTDAEADMRSNKNYERIMKHQEKINKHTNYFNNKFFNDKNTEEIVHTKAEESYIYFDKIQNFNSSFSFKETNEKVESEIKFNKPLGDSLCSNNKNSFNVINQFVEYPHTNYYNNPLKYNGKCSEENYDERVSKESNMCGFYYDKDFEDQYNKIIFKHKGI
jgi:hypothetical protein